MCTACSALFRQSEGRESFVFHPTSAVKKTWMFKPEFSHFCSIPPGRGVVVFTTDTRMLQVNLDMTCKLFSQTLSDFPCLCLDSCESVSCLHPSKMACTDPTGLSLCICELCVTLTFIQGHTGIAEPERVKDDFMSNFSLSLSLLED